MIEEVLFNAVLLSCPFDQIPINMSKTNSAIQKQVVCINSNNLKMDYSLLSSESIALQYDISLDPNIISNPFETKNDFNLDVVSISLELFKGTKPLEGRAKTALLKAIELSGKDSPTLKNRK